MSAAAPLARMALYARTQLEMPQSLWDHTTAIVQLGTPTGAWTTLAALTLMNVHPVPVKTLLRAVTRRRVSQCQSIGSRAHALLALPTVPALTPMLSAATLLSVQSVLVALAIWMWMSVLAAHALMVLLAQTPLTTVALLSISTAVHALLDMPTGCATTSSSRNMRRNAQ